MRMSNKEGVCVGVAMNKNEYITTLIVKCCVWHIQAVCKYSCMQIQRMCVPFMNFFPPDIEPCHGFLQRFSIVCIVMATNEVSREVIKTSQLLLVLSDVISKCLQQIKGRDKSLSPQL